MNMESLPLQNLFESKMYPSGEPNENSNKSTIRFNQKNVVHPTGDKLDYYVADTPVRVNNEIARCKDNGGCITQASKPLLIAFQLLAIFPVTFRKKGCKFRHCWFSFPSVINILVTFVIFGMSITIFLIFTDIFSKFRGTDFYTMVLMIFAQFGATILVFATGNFCASTFCKGWQALHDVTAELEIKNYGIIKYYVLFIPAALVLEGSFSAIAVAHYANRGDIELLVPPIVAFLGSALTNFIPNFITFSFSVVLWICGYLFDCLNKSISACLEQPPKDFISVTSIGIFPQDHAAKLAKLRRLHEDLCDAVRLLGKAFGFQLLLIFPATALRFIAGIYGILTDAFGLVPATMREFVLVQGLASIIAGSRIMLVILSSDAVMTKAAGILEDLKRARRPTTSDELNKEIDVFLSMIGSFPLEIKCCSIITLNLSFLSTAIPNVITYVLVLMQFKQGDDNAGGSCNYSQNSTLHSE